jgi:hypothetical protein
MALNTDSMQINREYEKWKTFFNIMRQAYSISDLVEIRQSSNKKSISGRVSCFAYRDSCLLQDSCLYGVVEHRDNFTSPSTGNIVFTA